MATEDSTTLNPCMSGELPNAEQITCALYEIANMSSALSNLCNEAIQGDETGQLTLAAEHLALKIGWTADRCLGFQVNSSDDWLMPPIWRKKAEQETSE